MAYLLTHFYPNGTEAEYNAALARVHPKGGLPPGQTFHAAGPTEDGWLVVALWDSRESCDRFIAETLDPGLAETKGALKGPRQEHAAEIFKLQKA